MTKPKTLVDAVLARGTALASMVAEEITTNPRYLRAWMNARKGGEKLNEAVEHVLQTMNVPSRTEFKRVIARVEALERELAEARTAQAAHPAPKRKAARKRPARAASSRRRKAPASGA